MARLPLAATRLAVCACVHPGPSAREDAPSKRPLPTSAPDVSDVLESGSSSTRMDFQPSLSVRFADVLPYTALDGTPWPEARVALPATAARFGLAAPLELAYVELNARGPRGTLVFLHGLGSYLKLWRYQLDAFAAQGWHVVALDLPGYGKSDKPEAFPYTPDALAEAVREACAALGLVRPVVVGHSLGGQTALAWAEAHPDALRALVLVAPAGFETFTPQEKAFLSAVVTPERIMNAREADVRLSVAAANFARWRLELEWLIEERLALASAQDMPAYARANVKSMAGLANDDAVREGLGRVRAPTLIVFGEADALIPNRYLHRDLTTRDVMRVGERAIPGAKLVGIGGCGHASQLDCPRELNAALEQFLEGLAPLRAGH